MSRVVLATYWEGQVIAQQHHVCWSGQVGARSNQVLDGSQDTYSCRAVGSRMQLCATRGRVRGRHAAQLYMLPVQRLVTGNIR